MPSPARCPATARRATAASCTIAGACLAALVVAVTLLGLLAPATPASAAPSASSGRCIGLVVDAGAGKVKAACVPYHTGLTGTKVLTDAGFTLRYGPSGLLCQIDNVPATCKTGNHYYWFYEHRKAGAAPMAWVSATTGPADYKPTPGTTEGWVFIDSKQDRAPDPVAYAALAAGGPRAHALPSASTGTSSSAPASASSAASAGSGARSDSPTGTTSRPAAGSSTGSGSTGRWTTIGVIVAIVVIALVAGGIAIRRRRT